jgi:hypothetical protein
VGIVNSRSIGSSSAPRSRCDGVETTGVD